MNRKLHLIGIVACLTLLLSACVPVSRPAPTAQTDGAASGMADAPAALSPADQERMAKIDDLLEKLSDAGELSGAVLIAKDGAVMLSKGYGLANLEYDIAITPQTKFDIGDMTQLFTALAVLQLVEKGAIRLDASICEYIDNCPERWQLVTVHQLLTQTSGIKDVATSPIAGEFARKAKSSRQIINSVRDSALLFAPGERWSYSLVNFILLGEIVHKVSGQPFSVYLNEHILQPLHMDDTGVDSPEKVLKNRASGYTNSGTRGDYVDLSGLDSSVGMYSTVEDLYKLDQALADGSLLDRELLDKMEGPLFPADPNADFGYGWWVMTVFGHHRLDLPTQSIPGFRSTYARFPDDRVTIIVLTNRELWAGDVTDEITKLLFDISPGVGPHD